MTAVYAAGPSAAELFAMGLKAEQAGKISEAYVLYSRAAALAPSIAAYWQRGLAIRDKAVAETESAAAKADDGPAAAQFAVLTPEELLAAQDPPPPALEPEPVRKSFHLRADARQLFTEAGSAWGLECEFDADYAAGSPIRFDLNDATYQEAFKALEFATGSFIVPLSSRKFLVVKDTQQKRTEREPVVSFSIPIPEAMSQQEFRDAVIGVQQALGLERVGLNPLNNTVVVRERISKALPAREMLMNILQPRAEVGIEMQLLDISRNDAVTYGVNLQNQFPLVPLTRWLQNKPSISSSLSGMLTFGGGKTLLGLGVMNASLVAAMSQSSGRLLIQSMVRAITGTPATFHVGDRYPVVTSIFTLPSGNTGSAGLAPAPVFNFEDLGLVLKVTPSVHDSNETTLDIDAQFKLLSGTGSSGLPIIANRALKSQARMKFGEWAVVAGLLNTEEAKKISGIAGLARLPVLGPLTSVRDNTEGSRQVLILIRPLLLRAPASEHRPLSIALGSENRPATPL